MISFNNYLKEFLGKLVHILPDNEKLIKASRYFSIGLVGDERIYINHFCEFAFQFESEINSRNEIVFLEYDFSFFPDSEEFKDVWITLDDSTKNAIWEYFVLLLRIAKKYLKA